jgi:hypothetical protein
MLLGINEKIGMNADNLKSSITETRASDNEVCQLCKAVVEKAHINVIKSGSE